MFALSPLPRTLEAALRDAREEKQPIRLSAIRDLVPYARQGESQAAQALRERLTDKDQAVRAEAALALSDADSRQSTDALLKAASQDSSVRVRQMAILALGELGQSTPQIASVLFQASRSSAAAERFQALLSLHQLLIEGSESAILDGMQDPDPALRRLSFRIARAHFADSKELPELARSRARAALTDTSRAVRAAAALLLAELGDASGHPIVLEVIASRGAADAEDEQAAIELSAELQLKEAIPALRRRAFGRLIRDPHAYQARIALARLGDQRATTELLRGLSAWTRDARTLAVAAIGRARMRTAREQLLRLMNQPERAEPAVVREALELIDRGPDAP